MSVIPRRFMWLVLRYVRGAITGTILTPARLMDTTAPAGSGAACLSAPDLGITAGTATRGVGATVMRATTAGAVVTAMAVDTDIVADITVLDPLPIAAAVQGLERPVAIAA